MAGHSAESRSSDDARSRVSALSRAASGVHGGHKAGRRTRRSRAPMRCECHVGRGSPSTREPRQPAHEAGLGVAVVERRNDLVLQSVVQGLGVARVLRLEVLIVLPVPMHQPIGAKVGSASFQTSSHQPSNVLRFKAPLTPAFMPPMPHASSGRRGVFSHRSTPRESARSIVTSKSSMKTTRCSRCRWCRNSMTWRNSSFPNSSRGCALPPKMI